MIDIQKTQKSSTAAAVKCTEFPHFYCLCMTLFFLKSSSIREFGVDFVVVVVVAGPGVVAVIVVINAIVNIKLGHNEVELEYLVLKT